MSDIKTREVVKGTIKTIDKSAVATQKTKDNIVNVKQKSESVTSPEDRNVNEYAVNRIETSTRATIVGTGKVKQKGNESVKTTKDNIIKTKSSIKNVKTKLTEKRKIKNTTKGIKTSQQVAKKSKKVATESVKASQRAIKYARETARRTYHGVKLAVKATISSIKAIIAGTKALISALIAGGWIALIVIVVICLIGLLVGSIFGIFFSGEKSSANSITMRDVIAECNQEFSDKLQNIQDTNPHDEYILEGNMATWKDVLIIYAVKQSGGNNQQEIATIDNNKKQVLKNIFWDMNQLTHEVKTEMVIEQGVNALEKPKEVQKQVLHITITSKTVEQMKTEYHFTPSHNIA